MLRHGFEYEDRVMGVAGRLTAAVAATAMMAGAVPAQAQFFFQPPVLATGQVTGQEPAFALPGATPKENEANLLWSMRAALNVSALQCDLARSLLNVPNYNAILVDHRSELQGAFDTLAGYFTRIKKSKPAGQTALDQYFTRLYSSFSTVGGQLTFCVTSHSVGRDAIFAPRGTLLGVAQGRMAELRASLAPAGEQMFPGFQYRTSGFGWLPDTDKKCWKKNRWTGACAGPNATATVAAR